MKKAFIVCYFLVMSQIASGSMVGDWVGKVNLFETYEDGSVRNSNLDYGVFIEEDDPSTVKIFQYYFTGLGYVIDFRRDGSFLFRKDNEVGQYIENSISYAFKTGNGLDHEEGKIVRNQDGSITYYRKEEFTPNDPKDPREYTSLTFEGTLNPSPEKH